MIFLLAAFLLASCQVNGSSDEYRLLQQLRKDYDPMERPVKDHSNPVNVSMELILIQLIDVDTKNQIISLSAWTPFTWHDHKMQWNPANYSGIKDIRLPTDLLWKPDVYLYNSADGKSDSRFQPKLVVSHTGDIIYTPARRMKAVCQMDLTRFPFDSHFCQLKFGSWSYTGNKLNLLVKEGDLMNSEDLDLSFYSPNSQWSLEDKSIKREVYKFQDEVFVQLLFHLKLERRTGLSRFFWFAPGFLFLVVNALSFLLSPTRAERLILGTINLLAVVIFLSFMNSLTSFAIIYASNIVIFLFISITIIGSSLVLTMLIAQVYHKGGKMSLLLKRVFLSRLPQLLGLQSNKNSERSEAEGALLVPHEEKGNENESKRNWQLLALVLDRICFLVLTVIASYMIGWLILTV